MNRMTWTLGIGMLAACILLTGCPKKLTADFSADAVSGTAPLTVRFTDRSAPADTPITAWHWLFGDGAGSTEQNPSHVYADAGNYNVSLEVSTPADSNTALELNFITVAPPAAGYVETVMLPGNVPLEMVWVPAGTFTMGSLDTEQQRGSDEGPAHLVALDGYWMGKYEVTQAQWKAVMGGSNPSWFQGGQGMLPVGADTDARPVDTVSWNNAQSFILALNTATGAVFRLPSEAEWEYACRAGNHVPAARFYWGDDLIYADIGNYAWYLNNSVIESHDAGQKTANAFGLYDMSGNVWEWCQDWYHSSYAGAPTDGSAWESPAGLARVIRGGGWSDAGNYCRSACRDSLNPLFSYSHLGFRLAK